MRLEQCDDAFIVLHGGHLIEDHQIIGAACLDTGENVRETYGAHQIEQRAVFFPKGLGPK